MANATIKAIALRVKDAFLAGKFTVTLNGQKYDIAKGGRPHEYYLCNDTIGEIGLRFFANDKKLSFFLA